MITHLHFNSCIMKKIFRLFAAFAATTMAFSCMEEANPETPGTDNGGTSYNGPMTTLTFSLGELETKTAWDGVNHTWSDGDQIKIVYGTEDDAYTVAEVVNGNVTATVGDVDTYYAIYPHNNGYALSVPEGAEEAVFNVTIPQTQNGSFKSANVMAAKTSKDDLNLAFKNLTHIIKFTLSEGCEYTRFQFRSNSDVVLNGKYDVTFGDDISLKYKSDNSGYIYFNVPSGQSGPFYLGFVPGAEMTYGFGYSARRTSAEGYIAAALSKSGFETTRSGITNLGEIDQYLRNSWYIKDGGEGDGSSWANAGDAELLISLLNKTQLTDDRYHNGVTHEWKLGNAKIHVAAGTYDIQAANNNANFTPNGLTENTNVTIIGGYPANAAEGAQPDGSETIFTTGNTVINSRIFDFNAVKTGTLKFKGISFKKENANAVGLLNFRGTVSGNVTFEDCVISVQTGNDNQGIVRVTPTAKENLMVSFNGCRFINNSGSSLKVGAIYATNAQIRINECVFDGNKGTQTGDIQYGTATTLFINRTVFKNSENTYSSNTSYTHASSISNSATASTGDTLCVNNSVFYNNMSKPTNATHRITPAIFSKQRHYMINTSVDNSSYQSVRVENNNTTNIMLNNVIVNHLESYPSIVQSADPDASNYNVMIFGTSGKYKSPHSGDTNLSSQNNISISWSDEDNNFTWILLNDVALTGNTTKTNVETTTQTNYPAFDKWLKTVSEDPYGIDFKGNKRNAEKLNPGAWDPGL